MPLARTANNVMDLPGMAARSAWVLAQIGEASEALTWLRDGEQLLEHHLEKGHLASVGWTCYSLGRAALLLGRLDEARSLAERAIKYSLSCHGYSAHALHLLGDIAMHLDQYDAGNGEVYYRKALALAEPRGMRPLIAHCHLGLGTLYRRTDRRQEGREYLAIAAAMYREMNMRFWAESSQELT